MLFSTFPKRKSLLQLHQPDICVLTWKTTEPKKSIEWKDLEAGSTYRIMSTGVVNFN
jgi:hypothetical protein